MHKKQYLFMLLMSCYPGIIAFSNHSFLTYRSQGVNLARADAGWQRGNIGRHSLVALEYTRSFDPCAISNYFFGAHTLTFSGSRSPNRGSCDILADYFGLPMDFKSTLSFDPRITNVIADIDFYWHHGDQPTGFTIYVDLPIANSAWDLNICESIITTGTEAYPAGYMSNARIEPENLLSSPLDVLSCGRQFGDLGRPLQYGRICNSQKATKLADIHAALGYTFVNNESWLFNAHLHAVVPTGTRPQSAYLFEPQIGNGRHWGLGGGLTFRTMLLGDVDSDWNFSFCFDSSVEHLFASTQKRSYDLKCKPGSRYMLVEDMIRSISFNQGFSPTPLVDLINRQYITRLFYVVDVTTLDSKIKINAQADITAQFKVQHHNWDFALGYNFWVRSAESLVSRECLIHNFYGIKGDAQLYGFLNIGGGVELPLPLNATQSEATLLAPQGAGNTVDNFVNNNADNAALMFNVGLPLAQTTADSLAGTGVTSLEQVNGSNPAIVLSDNDIDNCSGLSPRALSHKVFGSFNYHWDNENTISGQLGFGAEGEFSGETDCVKTAISQWGVWIKGGINY